LWWAQKLKKMLAIAVLLALLSLAVCDQECESLLAKVNPFVGTGGLTYGYGSLNPGAQAPFGALRLGPDTTATIANIAWRHFSGYNPQDDKIRAFSHTHLVGAGINNLGNFGVMPMRRDSLSLPHSWWSTFKKESEHAVPGQYSVYLDSPRVQADLLATSRFTAVHRYSFDSTSNPGKASVLVDACHAARLHDGLVTDHHHAMCKEASMTIAEDMQSFDGFALFYEDVNVWIHGEFVFPDEPARKVQGWETCMVSKGGLCHKDVGKTFNNSVDLFSFASLGRLGADGTEANNNEPFVVELHVGISFVSSELAKANYDEIFSGLVNSRRTFAERKSASESSWCDELGHLQVTDLDADVMGDFSSLVHTMNYHSRMSPSNLMESGGAYRGLDSAVHNSVSERSAQYGNAPQADKRADYAFFSDLSLWDTFRTQHPWLLLTDERVALGVIRSLAEMTVQQGGFPRWVLLSHDISCMVGLHGMALITEAIHAGWGQEHFDLSTLYKYLLPQLTDPAFSGPNRRGEDVTFYLDKGYVASEQSDKSPSMTVTYAYDDWLLSQISAKVGDIQSSQEAAKRAHNVLNLWNSTQEYLGFICARDKAGTYLCPDNPVGPSAWEENIEGDAYHWGFFGMVQDPSGLIPLLYSSPSDFVQSMDKYFSKHVELQNEFKLATTGLPNPYYWAGNEISSFTPWLFAYAGVSGACTYSQSWSRKLLEIHYSNTPSGLPGNDDYGSMSSWFVFAALGLFPRAGSSDFVLGSPRVSQAAIRLRKLDGSTSILSITTHDNSAENIYVSRALLNGVELSSPIVSRAQLTAAAGASLEFFMSPVKQSALCP